MRQQIACLPVRDDFFRGDHRVGDIAGARGDDLQANGARAIKARQGRGLVVEGVGNSRDVTEQNAGAVLGDCQRNALEVFFQIGLFGGFQLQVCGVVTQGCLHRSGRACIDGTLHVRQRQAQ